MHTVIAAKQQSCVDPLEVTVDTVAVISTLVAMPPGIAIVSGIKPWPQPQKSVFSCAPPSLSSYRVYLADLAYMQIRLHQRQPMTAQDCHKEHMAHSDRT